MFKNLKFVQTKEKVLKNTKTCGTHVKQYHTTVNSRQEVECKKQNTNKIFSSEKSEIRNS